MTDIYEQSEPRDQPRTGYKRKRQRKGATNFNKEGSTFGKTRTTPVRYSPPSQGVQATSLKPDDASPKFICLVDLEPHHCRWPYGGDDGSVITFCGHNKKPNSSYCTYHWGRACA